MNYRLLRFFHQYRKGLLAITLLTLSMSGCSQKDVVPPPDHRSSGISGRSAKETGDQLFEVAVNSLGRYEEFRSSDQAKQFISRMSLWLMDRTEAEREKFAAPTDPLATDWVDTLSSLGVRAKAISEALTPAKNDLEARNLTNELRMQLGRIDLIGGTDGVREVLATETELNASIARMKESLKDFQDEKQLENLESLVADAFIQKAGTADAWKELTPFLTLARQLDYPERLKDPVYFGGYLEEISRVAGSAGMQRTRELYQMYAQVVRNLPGSRQTKTFIQCEIVLHMIDQAEAMRKVVSLIEIRREIDRLASAFYAFRESGIAHEKEMLVLADQLVRAAKRPDLPALTQAIGKLAEMTQPDQSADFAKIASRLRPCAEQMTPLITATGEAAATTRLAQMQSLVSYTTEIQSLIADVAGKLDGLAGEAASPARIEKIRLASEQLIAACTHFMKLTEEFEYYANLSGARLADSDHRELQEAALMRDVAYWCRGENPDDLQRVTRLFDWTFHAIAEDRLTGQLDTPRMMQFPGETLLCGRGSLEERCELFIQLVRQLGLDAVLLGVRPGAQTQPVPWALAVFIERDKELYLFDPNLELPIPAPDGISFGADGTLAIRPATLSQVLDQPELLDRLSIDASHHYAYSAETLQKSQIVAMLDASPASLAMRMRLIEATTSGSQRLQISTHPSGLAERLRAVRGVADVQLWSHPWDTRLQRVALGDRASLMYSSLMLPLMIGEEAPLLRGRMLHLRGVFASEDDESTAITWYQKASPTTKDLKSIQEFIVLIQEPQLRARQEEILLGLQEAKQNAEFWSGQITLQRNLLNSAEDFLNRRTLAEGQSNPWYDAARELLGQVYETQKTYAKAADVYRTDATPETWWGRFLRARWIMQTAGLEDHEPLVPGFAGSTSATDDTQTAETSGPTSTESATPTTSEEALPVDLPTDIDLPTGAEVPANSDLPTEAK